jgi:hypothetical protein
VSGPYHAIDSQLIEFVLKAGGAFRAAEGKDPEVEGLDLANWLRSGAEIGEGERELLAELVTGKWGKRKGRPDRVGAGHPYARAIVDFYLRCNADLGPRRTKIAKATTAEEFGESVRTIDRYLKDARERAEAIERAKAAVAK